MDCHSQQREERERERGESVLLPTLTNFLLRAFYRVAIFSICHELPYIIRTSEIYHDAGASPRSTYSTTKTDPLFLHFSQLLIFIVSRSQFLSLILFSATRLNRGYSDFRISNNSQECSTKLPHYYWVFIHWNLRKLQSSLLIISWDIQVWSKK